MLLLNSNKLLWLNIALQIATIDLKKFTGVLFSMTVEEFQRQFIKSLAKKEEKIHVKGFDIASLFGAHLYKQTNKQKTCFRSPPRALRSEHSNDRHHMYLKVSVNCLRPRTIKK